MKDEVETLRKEAEKLEAKILELETENTALRKSDLVESDSPDFENASDVIRWHGDLITYYMSLMRREKATVRLRLLNSSIDSWARAHRLSSGEGAVLRNEIAELREMIMKNGPRGIVRE